MSEEEYLTDHKKRAGIARDLRNLKKEGQLPNTRIEILLQCIGMLSGHGAHAEVQTWGNRLVGTQEKGWFLSFFEKAQSRDKLIYNFLGIMWFASLAFIAFLKIANERFGIDTTQELEDVRRWQDAMEENKKKFDLRPA